MDTDLRSMMEILGKTQSDLARLVGSRSRASEYLSGKRCVPIGDRRLMVDQWGASAEYVIMLPVARSP